MNNITTNTVPTINPNVGWYSTNVFTTYTTPEQEELWDYVWIDLEPGNKLVKLEGKAYGTYEEAKQAATVAFCKMFFDEMDDIDLYTLKLKSW